MQRQQFQQLGIMLGTHWTRETVHAMMQPQDPRERHRPREEMTVPLLLGMKPELRDYLIQSFGSKLGITPPNWYRQDQGEVVEGWDLSREEFVQMASMFTGLITKNYQ